ncbi:hypothetical protein L3Q82_012159 [Scortum barcoo]|uniref:Uncharacterized protein n=1 Tax=Scortum barcoo TaxID=214431 RepID=A0ACB8W6V1_9TELE|nr:hypothetical protein L3Q82_012159 [Scortum barcoo]
MCLGCSSHLESGSQQISSSCVSEATAAAGRRHCGGVMPGSPYNISKNDRELQQVVLSAAYSFNNQSNEVFLFKPSFIVRAQRQIVKGVRYVVEFKISRTVCRKRDNSNLSDCDFQPEGPLHQVSLSRRFGVTWRFG